MAGALVLIPVLAFFALHLVNVRAPGHLLRGAMLTWTILGAIAVLIFSSLPAIWFYPRNEALQAVRAQLDQLRGYPVKKGQIVLLLQGSSATFAWIKPPLLESILRDKGFPVRVFLLSTTGSGHFERLALLREWFRQFTEKESRAFRDAHVVFLREVLASYDREPFVGFRENAFGDRSVFYASPANIGLMLRAAWLPRGEETEDFPHRAALSALIAGHFLFNVFRVGAIRPLEPPRASYSNHSSTLPTEGAPPRIPRKKTFIYRTAREEYERESGDDRLPGFPELPWLTIRDRAIERQTSGWVDRVAYFTTPHLSANARAYEQSRLALSGVAPLRFDGGSDAVLAQLDAPRFWRDHVHGSPAGASIYTQWLAEQLIANWPQISGKPSPTSSDAL